MHGQLLKQFFTDLRRQKLRAALTMFGIFWGTCSIVLLVGFSNGIREKNIQASKGLGENIGIFWPGLTSKEYRGLPKGRRVRLQEADIVYLKKQCQTVERISPEFSSWNANVKVGKNVLTKQCIGVWPEFGEMRNLIPDAGSRFLNQTDMDDRRRVAFIGDKLAGELFPGKPAVGEQILVNGTPFTVIGVMKKKKQDSSYSGRDQDKVIIAATTWQSMFGAQRMNNFVVQAKPTMTVKMCQSEIIQLMSGKYRFDPTDKEVFSLWDVSENMVFFKNFMFAFEMFLVVMGIATLITGAIGVSNIMQVVLEERTKDIGIKMALGARSSYIVTQFMIETLMITACGGVLGFLFASTIISLAPKFLPLDDIGVPVVDPMIIFPLVGLLGLVGLLAGLVPARRAAKLQPVQALKLF